MLDNNKCILVYGMNQVIKYNLTTLGFKVIEVTPEMTKMTVEEILSGLRFQTFNPNPIKTKIIILNNFSDNEIREKISEIRNIVKDSIMAVSTPSNVKWTFDKLAEHLVEEKNWQLSNQKGRK